MRNGSPVLLAALWVAALIPATLARAALGEPAASVESDRTALGAVHRATTARNGHSVQELQVGSTLVREYVTPSGVVFAIAWNGLSHPDLTPLLGAHAAEYGDARRKARRYLGRRHQRLETDHIVVETWGRMRNLQGRAFVPALIPPGVVVDDIK